MNGRNPGAGRAPALLTIVVVLAGGCASRATELEPAPGAQPAPPGPGKGAAATVSGVTIVARSDAWSGYPPQLVEVTPVLVTIENEGGAPLRIRYGDFALAAPDGREYAAIPPYQARGTEVEPVAEITGFSRFRVAPYYAGYYPWLDPYDDFAFDRAYYETYYPQFTRINLPTGDMVRKALPEGVLAPGGRVSGFLYFQHVGREVRRVSFTAALVDAATGEQLGTARIPFTVG